MKKSHILIIVGVVIGLSVLAFLALVIGIFSFYFISRTSTNNLPPVVNNNPGVVKYSELARSDTFVLSGAYNGEEWEYELTGTLPNPCYSFGFDFTVEESYPEHVIGNVTVIPQVTKMMCPQVIKNVTQKGTLKVSKYANFTLKESTRQPQ